MNELMTMSDKLMTVREIAAGLGCDERTIQRHIKDICPEAVQQGKPTVLNERQVTEIKLRIERSGRNDLDNVVGLPKTMLEKQMLIKQAAQLQNEIIAQLTIERDEAKRRAFLLARRGFLLEEL